jgi:hypothetical protein
MGKNFLWLVYIVMAVACTGNGNEQAASIKEERVRTIQDLVREHMPISFPFVHNMHDDREIGWPIDDKDTIFFPSNTLIAGYLPDTSVYFGFIFYIPAGYVAPNEMMYYPLIRTFNKEGILIAEDDLFAVNSNDCYVHSFESFMDSQSRYTVTSVSVKQYCNDTNSAVDLAIEVYFTSQKILADGTIDNEAIKDTTFCLDSSIVKLVNASTKKYIIDSPTFTQTLWIGWVDYSTIRYDCIIISKIDECEQHYADTARIYMEDDYKYDKDIGGDHFLHEYHTYSVPIRSILIDMRYRDKIRLVLDNGIRETRCDLSGEVMQGKGWF